MARSFAKLDFSQSENVYPFEINLLSKKIIKAFFYGFITFSNIMNNQSILKILTFSFVYVFAFKEFSYITADTDLWGHIRFGEEIWKSGFIPQIDSFSFTANGETWINHEWLTEVLLYLIYESLGSGGLLVFKMVLGWTILSLLYFALKPQRNPYPFAISSLIIIPTMGPGFMIRPQLMTFLFTAFLIFLIRKFFEKNNRDIFWIPAIFLLWINCHGGVVAGLGIFGAVVVLGKISLRASLLNQYFYLKQLVTSYFIGAARGQKQFLEVPLKEKESHYWKLLALTFGGSCIAVLINPYGVELWAFFIDSLSLPRKIDEWAPIPLFSLSHWNFKVLVLVFLASLFENKKKRLWEIGIIAISMVFAFKSQRHTVLAAIVATPYITEYIESIAKTISSKYYLETLSKPVKQTLQIGLSFFIVFQTVFTTLSYNRYNYQVIVEPAVYPTYSTQFMEDNKIDGNIVAPFDWGEYLIWKKPKSKVAIDGRFRTVYPENIIRQAWNFWERSGNWSEILKDADIVIVKTKNAGDRGFQKFSNWKKIYQDPICMIYINKNDRNSRILKKYSENRLIHRKTPPPYYFPG